jgi:hypothetical protein
MAELILVGHLLTGKEVSQRLGVSCSWVNDHANGRRRPYLPSIKLGKCRRFEPSAVARFIEECRRLGRQTA